MPRAARLIERLTEMANRVGAEFVPDPKKIRAFRSKTIKGMPMPELKRDLARCRRALGNKKLLPQSVAYYRRRCEMLEAELNQQLKQEG